MATFPPGKAKVSSSLRCTGVRHFDTDTPFFDFATIHCIFNPSEKAKLFGVFYLPKSLLRKFFFNYVIVLS
jgi:hypothetical protein